MSGFSPSAIVVLTGEENHYKELCRELNRQRRSGSLCDVVLTVGGSSVKAHRAVLSAKSSYFNSMFSGNFLEKLQNVIDFSTMFNRIEPLQCLVGYMYTGKLKISWNNLEEILHAAALFLLDEACKLCSQFMLKNACLENCLHLWALAEQYSLQKLAKFCQNLARTRFHDYLLYQDETFDITPQFLRCISVKNSAEVFSHVPYCAFLNFIVLWVKHEKEERIDELQEILSVPEVQSRYPALKEFVGQHDFTVDPLRVTEAELQSRLDVGPSTSSGICVGRSSVTFHAEEEALVLQTIRSTGPKQVLQLYAYVGRTNRWWKFNPLPLDVAHNFDGLIVGFLDNNLVLARRPEDSDTSEDDDEVEVCLLDIKGGKIKDLPKANYTPENEHSRAYFVFQNSLLLCDCANSNPNDNSIFCELFIKVYNSKTNNWSEIHHQLLPNVDATGRYFRVMIETLVQSDRVYICMFHEYSIDQDPHNELLVLDVHLFCITMCVDKFEVQNLHYERDVRPMDESFADFVCTGTSDGVYFTEVSRSDWYLEDSAIAIHGTEISHTDATVKWHTRKLQTSLLPAIDIPLKFHPKYTGLCVLKGSNEKGVLFQVRRISPFISELWSFDVKQRIWKRLKPPPFDSDPIKIDVCRIPLEVLRDLEIAQYEYMTEKRQRSPLYIYELDGVTAKVLRIKGDYVDETDNEEEEELYDKECRLEDEWLEKQKPTKSKMTGRLGNLLTSQSDNDDDESDADDWNVD